MMQSEQRRKGMKNSNILSNTVRVHLLRNAVMLLEQVNISSSNNKFLLC